MKIAQALKQVFGFNQKDNSFEHVEPRVVIAPQNVKPLFTDKPVPKDNPREILVVQLDSEVSGHMDPEVVRQSIVNQLDKGNVVVVDGARSVSTHIITDSSCAVKKGDEK
ncbi:hypothetical protein L2095_23595 [Bacillus zanthoxyli]|nr:hypothetical protein [Bacillus zanthoxyli]